MKLKKDIVFLLVFTFFFYIFIFLVDTFFFEQKKESIFEEDYIDKSIEDFAFLWPVKEEDKEKYKDLLKDFKEELKQEKWEEEYFENKWKEEEEEKKTYFINIIPQTAKVEFSQQENLVVSFLESRYFFSTLDNLIVELYKKTVDVRWKFHKRVIKLFWIGMLSKNEFFSVFIHEFWHYIDLYFFVFENGEDVSNYFYEISWESTKVMKKWQEKQDFVSGYAMTNKYEDFAESFTYYLLHNKDFFEKALGSTTLMQKYNFFHKYFVFNEDLKKYDFSLEEKRKNYYWDITKISIDEEKFLQFLEK